MDVSSKPFHRPKNLPLFISTLHVDQSCPPRQPLMVEAKIRQRSPCETTNHRLIRLDTSHSASCKQERKPKEENTDKQAEWNVTVRIFWTTA